MMIRRYVVNFFYVSEVEIAWLLPATNIRHDTRSHSVPPTTNHIRIYLQCTSLLFDSQVTFILRMCAHPQSGLISHSPVASHMPLINYQTTVGKANQSKLTNLKVSSIKFFLQ